jgi:hypothetical protein
MPGIVPRVYSIYCTQYRLGGWDEEGVQGLRKIEAARRGEGRDSTVGGAGGGLRTDGARAAPLRPRALICIRSRVTFFFDLSKSSEERRPYLSVGTRTIRVRLRSRVFAISTPREYIALYTHPREGRYSVHGYS